MEQRKRLISAGVGGASLAVLLFVLTALEVDDPWLLIPLGTVAAVGVIYGGGGFVKDIVRTRRESSVVPDPPVATLPKPLFSLLIQQHPAMGRLEGDAMVRFP